MSKLIFEFEVEGTKVAVENLGDVKEAVKLVNKALLNTKEGSAEQKRLVKILGQLKSAQANVTEEVKRAKKAYEETNRFAKGSYKALSAELDRLKDSLKGLSKTDADGPLGKQMRARINAINKELKEFDASISRNAKTTKFASGSYRELNARLVDARKRYKELSEEERRGQVGKDTLKDIQRLDRELKDLDRSMGQYQRNVGNYASAFKGLGKAIGGAFLLGGATEIVQRFAEFVGESVKVFADFQRQVSFIGAVSGATKEELAQLEQQARDLGGTTEFTASQVAQLEIEYAKLGFKPAEILEATADTLNLATVAQSDLGETAAVVGATIRAFNLDTEETGRVANVAALAFSNSALDLSKFSTSMAIVAPVAASANVSLEETTALMGVLADAGVDASTVGSGLRNVFLDLAADGLTLEEALDQISNATDSNVKAVELFGKRGATVGTVLANNRTRVDELTKSFQGNAEFAGEAAEKIRGDLKGSFDNLSSATENLQLTLVSGFEGALKVGTDFLTNVVRGLSSGLEFLYDTFDPVFEALGELVGLFFDAESSGTLLDAAINFIAGTITVFANILTFTIRGVSNFVNVIMAAVNAVPFLSKAVDFLKGAYLGLYTLIGQFPAVINGVVSVALAAQKQIFNFGKRILLSAQILGKEIEGLISESAKKEAAELRRQRDNLKEGGESLGDAFKKGFNEAIVRGETPTDEVVSDKAISQTKRKAKTKGKEIADVLADSTISGLQARKSELEASLKDALIGSDRFKKIEKEIEEVDKKLQAATGKGAKKAAEEASKTATAYEQLTQRQKELKSSILEASLAGKDYSQEVEELRTVSEQLKTAQEAVNAATKDGDSAMTAAEGSVKALSEVVAGLRTELENASPENIGDIAKDLTDAEAKLKQAQDAINAALGKSDEDAAKKRIDEQLKASEEAIKKRTLLEIAALREKGLDVADFERQRELIELEAERQIQQEKTRIYEEGSLERLAAEQAAADKEAEINAQRVEDLKKTQAEKLQTFTAIAGELSTGINDVINNVSAKNQTIAENQIRNLEEYYAAEIEMAEGNEARQEELQQELDEKKQAIEKAQFERQKKVQIAAANISFATGLINILAAPTTIPDPFGAIFKGLKVAALTATHVTNIGKIKAQEYAEKGTYLESEGNGIDQIRNSVRASYSGDYNVQALGLGVQRGKSHAHGGNHTVFGNTHVEYERDEFVDVDEFGNLVIVNKKSTNKFRSLLEANKGRMFTGKMEMLSNVNSFAGYGKVFAQSGAIIPAPSSVASVTANVTGSGNATKSEFTNEQILYIADVFGKAVKTGAKEGTENAGKENDLQSFREKRLEQKLQI